MDRETISIPAITLEWNEWIAWNDLQVDARRGGVKVPNGMPGVYEVRHLNADERLTIGKAADLRMRVKQGLVKGKVPHAAGKKIRETEDESTIVVRWAVTDRPAAVEEELHRRHQQKFGRLPKYTEFT